MFIKFQDPELWAIYSDQYYRRLTIWRFRPHMYLFISV